MSSRASTDAVRDAVLAAYSAAQAALVRRLPAIDDAQDAMQEAVIKAWRAWPESGIPERPAAWLIVSGMNAYRDHYRRDALIDRSVDLESASSVEPLERSGNFSSGDDTGDEDILRLIFMCCHPGIAVENQLALTLKMLMGFSPAEIAKALMISTKTLEQRVTRAKRKIASSGISFELPRTQSQALRLDSVRQILYLIFNEGYHSVGAELLNKTLCRQAIQLARALCRSYPQPENFGLLSLMLFVDARADARISETGELITLDAQDRSQWKRSQIDEADVLLQKALRSGQIGSYQLQAAIAGVHSLAESAQQTDWQEVVGLYRRLLREQPGAVVQLNFAVALMMVDELADAEQILERLRQELADYSPYYAALARLYSSTGREGKAVAALERAAAITASMQEKRHYQIQIAALTRACD